MENIATAKPNKVFLIEVHGLMAESTAVGNDEAPLAEILPSILTDILGKYLRMSIYIASLKFLTPSAELDEFYYDELDKHKISNTLGNSLTHDYIHTSLHSPTIHR